MNDTVTNKTRPEKSKDLKNIPENKRNNLYLDHKNQNKVLESINEFSNSNSNNSFGDEIETNEELNQIKKLKKINLIEKDIDNLYKWEHLFNNFRPVSSYTTINRNKTKKEKNEENKNEEFKSPILLVDLPENQMNLFFGNKNYESSRNKKIENSEKVRKNSYNHNHTTQKVSHNIRPMSMYSPRIQNSCYYFSSVFSDYYKEEFKSFCNKMPILKAKLKIAPDKLRREIIKHDKRINQKEKLLYQLSTKESVNLDKQDLIIAGQRKNPIPLLKSIFKQNYPGYEVIKESPKLYLNTMKPYGSDYKNVDYFQNDRWRLSNEIIKMRNQNKNNSIMSEKLNNNYEYKHKQKKRKLLLSYYDDNDPYIILFNKNIKNIKGKTILENNNQINIINSNIMKTKINIPKLIDNKDMESNEPTSERNEHYLKSKTSEKPTKKGGYGEPQKSKPNEKIIKKSEFKDKNKNIYSTTLNNLGAKDDNLYKDYSSSNCFPLKTSSDVGNTSYNKINRFIREKKLLNKLKLDYSLTQSKITKKTLTKDIDTDMIDTHRMFEENKKEINLMLESKKIKPKKNFSLYETAVTDERSYSHNDFKNYKHWDKGGNLISNNSHKVNYLCFNNYIKTAFNKDLISFKKNEDNQYFYPMNAYNKLSGKYYRHNDKYLKDKNNIIKNLFDYSRDEPENDFETTKKTGIKNDELSSELNDSSIKLNKN